MEENPSDMIKIEQSIENDVLEDIRNSGREITQIELRQAELNSLILSIENANRNLENLIQSSTDQVAKSKWYTAISYNIDRLSKLYSVYREFEDTKYKYLTLINDSKFKKHRLLRIDIPKIEDQIRGGSEEYSQIFTSLIKELKQAKTEDKKIVVDNKICDNPEYEL